jgi:hypothetical protein
MTAELSDVTGYRGEKILELRLTDFAGLKSPLFRPGFLGDKWPSIDFYVELRNVRRTTPYFFAQAKSTARELRATSTTLKISSETRDIERLLRIPGPTYIFGIHEPSARVFVKSVHNGSQMKSVSRIPVSYELTTANLLRLHLEVQEFWKTNRHKPTGSVFA